MTKVCRLQNMGCASCAAKMERQISRLRGVKNCRVNFLTGRMSLEADEAAMEGILGEAEHIIRRIEPQVQVQR